MAMDTIVNRGYIKMHTFMATKRDILNLVIDFELSSCKLDDIVKNTINRLSREKDFKRIMSADVESHFKIAKILSNAMGWRIEFDSNRDLRYKVYIPLTRIVSPEEEAALDAECDDSDVGNDDPRPTPGIHPERIIASQQSQRNKNKKYLEQNNKSKPARPLTVDESYKNRGKFFQPVPEEPEGMEDLDEGIQHMDSNQPLETQSYRDDSRQCQCASFLLMNSDQKILIEESLGVKCHEHFTNHEVIKLIRKSLDRSLKKNCKCKLGYNWLIIDT